MPGGEEEVFEEGEGMKEYQEFLKSKLLKVEASGFSVDDSDINPMLFQFQRDIVRWSCKRGKAAELMAQGLLIFSPISHTHPIHLAGNLPGDWEFWKEYDRSFLEWADELWVMRIDGWEQSKGVKAEIEIAKGLKKEIVYL